MKRWQGTFDRLDRLSRTRALTDTESALLEHAIRQIDSYVEPARRSDPWRPSEIAELRRLIEGEGMPIRAAARRIGRSGSAGIGKWHRLKAA